MLDKKGKHFMAIADVKAREKAEAGPAVSPSNVPEDTDDFIGKAMKQVVSDRLKTMQKYVKVSAKRQRTVALGKRSPADVAAAQVPGTSSASGAVASVDATPVEAVPAAGDDKLFAVPDGDDAPVGKGGKGKGRGRGAKWGCAMQV